MTERLYYTDSYLREFRASIVGASEDGRLIYLDRSAFYPASGGQPSDSGFIGQVTVLEVIDEGERIAHRTSAAVEAVEVECRLDWPRRWDHMQQHSGQHVLSAVFVELFGLQTISFHLGSQSSTIDLDTSAADPEKLRAAERRANEIVSENHSITVSFHEHSEWPDLRKHSERKGVLRIISIDGLDRSACGGTHVRSTGEIGPILLRGLDKVRGSVRVEFLCGMRAIVRARADFDALSGIAQMLSAPLDGTTALVASQLKAAKEANKQRRRLAAELSRYQGRELYEATTPDEYGFRRATRKQPSGSLEELRWLAQSFTMQPKALFLGAVERPASILLAVSADGGIDAGKALEAAVRQAGGRGGGNARLAQGSLPSSALLETVLPLLSKLSPGVD